MFPDTPPAAATAMAIIGLNLGVYLLWKVPPAWRMLNRHFIIVNAWPRATSMIGSVFSHQTLKHLALNMGLLWFIGTRREYSTFGCGGRIMLTCFKYTTILAGVTF